MPPYHPDLHLSEWKSKYYSQYALVLNKFNVLNNHLLVVTTHFESQFSPITASNLRVMHEIILDVDGFGFYNAGKEAGPSQLHRHMQIVPRRDNYLPYFDTITEHSRTSTNGTPFSIEKFQFKHSICQIPDKDPSEHDLVSSYNLCLSHSSLPTLRIQYTEQDEKEEVMPHNILMGANWIMVVPRTISEYRDICANGLNFIGSFYVKNEETFQNLKEVGPMKCLVKLGKPKL